jgi:competence protein ComEA
MKPQRHRALAALLAIVACSLGVAQARPRNEARAPIPVDPPASTPEALPPKLPPAPAGRVDLNSASEKELAALPGVGVAKARLIVKFRPYDSPDMLKHQQLLTNKEFQAIKHLVTATPAAGRP